MCSATAVVVLACDHVASAAMRLSEFWALMEQEFGGPYGRTIAGGHAIHAMGDKTAVDAIEAGESVRAVWLALCNDLQIPEERRFPADRRRP